MTQTSRGTGHATEP